MVDFEKHMGLVHDVYKKKFKQYWYLKDDLCQEGFIALFLACKNFNENKGNKFSTYAFRSIYNNMLAYLLRKEQKHKLNSIVFSELEEKNIRIDSLETTVGNDEDLIFLKDLILNNLIKLTKRNKKIVYAYLFENLNQSEIGAKFNMTQPCVSLILKKFEKKIKEEYKC